MITISTAVQSDERCFRGFELLRRAPYRTRLEPAEAKRVAESWTGSVITTEYVLTEVANHLSGSSQHREKFGRLLADLDADANTHIVESSHDVWRRGVNLYLQRPDKEWSLTDCISFIIMEERGLKESLTVDHHFEQAGFIRLLQADD